MTGKWSSSNKSPLLRLGEMAIRANGLIVGKRIQSLQAMIDIHRKDLRRTPQGRKALKEAESYFTQLKRLIKHGTHRGE